MKEKLYALTSSVGVSGEESKVYKTINSLLPDGASVHTDSLGNITAEYEGEGLPFLIDAHIDQIGMIVTDIDNEGFIKFDKCGGVDTRILTGHEVIVWGDEPVYGVVCSVPPHLQKGDDSSKVDIHDMAIDVGLSKENAAKKIGRGDRISLKIDMKEMLGGRVSAPALDNRAGAAVIIRAAEILKEQNKNYPLTLLFSAQEEIGCIGAGCGAFNSGCEETIVVDVSFALTPDSSKTECGELDKGPMIGISPILDNNNTRLLKECAEKAEIPYQIEVMNGRTGTNADSITTAAGGKKCVLISIPLRYMHMGIEVVSLNDLENTARLLAEYITRKQEGRNA